MYLEDSRELLLLKSFAHPISGFLVWKSQRYAVWCVPRRSRMPFIAPMWCSCVMVVEKIV